MKTTKVKWILLVAICIVGLLFVAACGQSQSGGESKDTGSESSSSEAQQQEKEVEVYKIGFVNHLTGDGALYGQSALKGVELGLKEINEAGGVNGKQLKLVVEDDRMVAADAITALRKVVETDKVPVVIGSSASSVTLSMLPVAQQYGIVEISTNSTNPFLRKYKGTYFGMMPTDESQGKYWADFAKDKGFDKVAVMYINNDYGIGVKDAFLDTYQGEVLIVEPYDLGKTDFRTEVLKVKAKNPPVVFIVGHVKEGGIVLKQAHELGLDVPFYGDVSLESSELLEIAGEGANNFAVLRVGSKGTPEWEKFENAFKKEYGQDPTIWSDFAYDAALLVAKAIEQEGYSAEGIRKFFQEVEGFPGASGKKSFDEDGICEAQYDFYKVENGEFVFWDWKNE